MHVFWKIYLSTNLDLKTHLWRIVWLCHVIFFLRAERRKLLKFCLISSKNDSVFLGIGFFERIFKQSPFFSHALLPILHASKCRKCSCVRGEIFRKVSLLAVHFDLQFVYKQMLGRHKIFYKIFFLHTSFLSEIWRIS